MILKTLTTCNFRYGVDKSKCHKKYDGNTEGGLSLYGDCDGEDNCMFALTYGAVIKLVENQKR